jgi:hypothetical protein
MRNFQYISRLACSASGPEFVLYTWDAVLTILTMPLACIHEELTHGAQNHARPGSRSPPTPAGMMMDADFSIAISGLCQAVQQFGVDHRSARLQWILVQELRM